MLLLPIHCSWCFLSCCKLWIFFPLDHHYYWCILRQCVPSQIFVHYSINIFADTALVHIHLLLSIDRYVSPDVHRVLPHTCLLLPGSWLVPLRSCWYLPYFWWCLLGGWVHFFLQFCPWSGFPMPRISCLELLWPCWYHKKRLGWVDALQFIEIMILSHEELPKCINFFHMWYSCNTSCLVWCIFVCLIPSCRHCLWFGLLCMASFHHIHTGCSHQFFKNIFHWAC